MMSDTQLIFVTQLNRLIFLTLLLTHGIQGSCNVTLWPRVRFQYRLADHSGPCFFRLPNRPSTTIYGSSSRTASSSYSSPSAAAGAIDPRHWIEIAFSSFHMSRVVNQTSCQNGHLKILETMESSRSTTSTFCGSLPKSNSRYQIYLTNAKSVTLFASGASENDIVEGYFDILSADVFRKRYPNVIMTSHQQEQPNRLSPSDLSATMPSKKLHHWYDMDSMADGRCGDVLMHNCPSVCRLSSPNYPVSIAPRNLSCRYRITFDRKDWQVVLGGRMTDRYDLSYHPNCTNDRLLIYEKLPASKHYEQIAVFCGQGKIPKILAQGNDVMVELIMSPTGDFRQGFRLSVAHHRRKKSKIEGNIVFPCHHSIVDDDRKPSQELSAYTSSDGWRKQGSFDGPKHWFPRMTDCVWSLIAASQEDRIWVEIHSRRMLTHGPSAVNSSDLMLDSGCLFHRLEVNGQTDSLTLCGGSHSTEDTAKMTPLNDSYHREHVTLLSRDRVDVRFFSRLGSLTGTEIDFNIFYMFLPAIEDESESAVGSVGNPPCNRTITGEDDGNGGTLHLIENRLLLRQNKRLTCRYRFEAPEYHRVRITLRRLTFDPIRQCGSEDDCSDYENRHRFDSLIVSDRNLQLGCFCQSTIANDRNQHQTTDMVMDSSSNLLDLQLNLDNIYDEAYKDESLYRFTVDYTWIADRCGRPVDSDQSGLINWRSDPSNSLSSPVKSCSWLVEFPTNDRILLKINAVLNKRDAFLSGNDCQNHPNLTTVSLVFNNGSRRHVEQFCENSLNFEIESPFSLRYLHVQLTSSSVYPDDAYHLKIKWNVLFQTNFDSKVRLSVEDEDDSSFMFRCPMSKWFLPRELVCNGQIDCPQQEVLGHLLDEHECHSDPNQLNNSHHHYYPWLIVLLVCFSFSVMVSLASVSTHMRKWKEINNKASS